MRLLFDELSVIYLSANGGKDLYSSDLDITIPFFKPLICHVKDFTFPLFKKRKIAEFIMVTKILRIYDGMQIFP